MKVCIFGSREFNNYELLKKAIESSGFEITEVVSGTANGADKLGERWAKENNIPIKKFPALWDDLNAPGAVVAVNKWGKEYNKMAGHQRNSEMCEYADAFITICGGTPGTDGMIKLVKKSGKPLYIHSEQNFVEF